jgi:hypothetical protein
MMITISTSYGFRTEFLDHRSMQSSSYRGFCRDSDGLFLCSLSGCFVHYLDHEKIVRAARVARPHVAITCNVLFSIEMIKIA